MRIIDSEASKTYLDKIASGFFMKYMNGKGLDISYKSDGIESILPEALLIDFDLFHTDATLKQEDKTQDFVYSNRILNESEMPLTILKEFFRVIKPGGFLVLVVPNILTTYELGMTCVEILHLTQRSLRSEMYKICFLEEGDKNFDYTKLGEPQPNAQTEITIVIQKLDIK